MKYDRERNPHNATRTSTRVIVKETQETLNASSGQENITRGGDSHGARTEGTREEGGEGESEETREEERLEGNGGMVVIILGRRRKGIKSEQQRRK